MEELNLISYSVKQTIVLYFKPFSILILLVLRHMDNFATVWQKSCQSMSVQSMSVQSCICLPYSCFYAK